MARSRIVVEQVDIADPAERERRRAAHRHFRMNTDWLQAHWADVLPQAYGKFLAVAGQEPFVADTVEEARKWAAANHPEDTGPFVEYVLPPGGARFYSNRTVSRTGSAAAIHEPTE